MSNTLAIEPIPALRDNYVWGLAQGGLACVIDPGEAAPVERWLDTHRHRLAAILITHHHPDHTGGVAALKSHHGARVYGPATESIPGRDQALAEGDTVTPLAGGPTFRVLDIPGHTSGHIAYYGDKRLFCGDTLFSGGCGRAFEGTFEQLYASLAKLAALPGETAVYAGHEYTVANLDFACHVLPDDVQLEEARANALETRNNGRVTLPSSIAREHGINVFLRAEEQAVREAIERKTEMSFHTPVEVFTALRRCKDHFRGD